MSSKNARVVVPGQLLGPESTYTAGLGTYVEDSQIYASKVGHLMVIRPKKEESSLIIQVSRSDGFTITVPLVGSIVLGRVIRVNYKFATVKIMIIDSEPCKEAYHGIIRVQDVKETEPDKVQIYRSFRPGDVVRAQIISLGDSRFYYLSSAKNELGVIFAESFAGHVMIPISWDKMICPKTKVIEYRKCAKPSN